LLYRRPNYRKPKPISVSEFTPWAPAHFRTQETRNQFLDLAATLSECDVEVEPMPDKNRGARVRWRSGQFLALNDLAYAHGGRIIVMQRRGA
jgi:hypothetical protein